MTKTFRVTYLFSAQAAPLGQGITVLFNPKLAVTTTKLVPFSLTKLLSEVGGILGLWLGLGMVQLGELCLPRITLESKIGIQDKVSQLFGKDTGPKTDR